eukprot:TRINITY_DN91707_c0_g1_i1.p1 TRINITY_DN91707_c0_g1~~TRINITY_DN91707_c0_g1_i1.p1  ORF type:complete len:940 (+),score=329.81 TRINITY_DN91707_c0_g1_i1:123-2942(+)
MHASRRPRVSSQTVLDGLALDSEYDKVKRCDGRNVVILLGVGVLLPLLFGISIPVPVIVLVLLVGAAILLFQQADALRALFGSKKHSRKVVACKKTGWSEESRLEEGSVDALAAYMSQAGRSNGSTSRSRILGDLPPIAAQRKAKEEAIEENVALLQDACDATAQEQSRIQEDIQKAKKDMNKLEEERKRLREQLAKTKEDLPRCSEEAAKFAKQVEEARREKEALAAEVAKAAARLEADRAERDRMAAQQESVKQDLDKSRSAVVEVREAVDQAGKDKDLLKQTLDGLQKELSSSKQTHAELVGEQDKMLASLQSAQRDRDVLLREQEELRASAKSVEEQVSRLDLEKNSLAVTLEKQRANLEGAQHEAEELARRHAALRGDMDKYSKEQAEVHEELQLCRSEAEEARAAATQASAASDDLKVKLSAAQGAVDEVKRSVSAAAAEREAAQKSCEETRQLLAEAEHQKKAARQQSEELAKDVAAVREQGAELYLSYQAAESERRKLLSAVQDLRDDFQVAETARLDLAASQAAATEQVAKCSAEVEALRGELASSSETTAGRLEELQSSLQEELHPMRKDIGILQRQVGEHEEVLQMLRIKERGISTGDLSPRGSSRSASAYEGSEHGLSSCGVQSSAATPRGSRSGGILGGRRGILRAGSFCSSNGSESNFDMQSFSSAGDFGKQILAGKSFASSDGGFDDSASERSFSGFSGISGSSYAAGIGISRPIGNEQELMDFAQGMKPLLVTRKDLARVLTRLPEALVLGEGGEGNAGQLTELVDAIFRSVICIVRIDGSERLAFGCGLALSKEAPYSLGRLQTRFLLRVNPTFACPAKGGRPAPVPEDAEHTGNGDDAAAGQSSAPEAAAPSLQSLEVRLSDISSRDLFLAELVGPYSVPLSAAAADPRCNAKALRRRRHDLRHAKEALSLAIGGKPKTDS